MKRLKLLGAILFVVGLALLFILVFEEFFYNLNYYYNHQANFDLLFFFGTLLFGIGFWLMIRERKQNPS